MAREQVTKLFLDSEEMQRDLQWLKEVAESSYGPFGRAAVFQPSPGGHVTVTSRSEKIFQMLRTSNPVVKTILMSLQAHSQRHKDCGLFAALLVLNLILRGMKLGLPRRKVAVVTSYALSLVADYLKSEQCECKRELEFSSVQHMMNLVRSCICSKTAVCALNSSEVDCIASLLLQGFLHVIPTPSASKSVSVKDQLHIHTILGRSATHSKLFQGVLVEDSEGDIWRWKSSSLGGKDENETIIPAKRDQKGLILTALFDISMTGDVVEDVPRVVALSSADGSMSGTAAVEGAALAQLMAMAESLVQQGVGFLGCQKCVHPLVKEYLTEEKVVVVERLSSFHIGPVRDATGGQLISSLALKHPQEWLGRLKRIRRVSIEGRRYLVLEGLGTHATLVLCCKSEVAADELKPLCTSAMSSLEYSLCHPNVLYGGGCTETVLSHFLMQKAEVVTEATLEELECDKKTHSRVLRCTAESFSAVASSLEHYGGLKVTDSEFHHCWSFPPYDYMYCGPAQTSDGGGDKSSLMDALAGTTCCCGAVRLTDLPGRCEWQCLHAHQRGFSVIPDEIKELLAFRAENSSHQHQTLSEEQTHSDCNVTTRDGGNKNSLREASSGSVSLDKSMQVSMQTEKQREISSGLEHKKRVLELPSVCDPFLPKLNAVELSNDLASTVLRIALAISERMS